MKRTLLKEIPGFIPSSLLPYVSGGNLYDSSCSPEARVIFSDKDSGYFIKSAPLGSLKSEALMQNYFCEKGLSSRVLEYFSDTSENKDFLVSERVRGEDCTFQTYLDDPKRLCIFLGEKLRELHSLDFSDCPVKDRMSTYFKVAKVNYEKRTYDPSYTMGAYRTLNIDEAYRAAELAKTLLNGKVLLHGDYCLPNIVLDDWRFSGFIDLGNGGVGDPHIDIYWGAWTLNFNLGTDKYRTLFYDAYGRDAIDTDKILAVSLFEAFG